MGQILDALGMGELRPEIDVDEWSPEHKKYSDEALECQEELERKLNEEEKEMLDKLMTLLASESACYSHERFVYGFRLGVRMMAESLLDVNDFVHKGTLWRT